MSTNGARRLKQERRVAWNRNIRGLNPFGRAPTACELGCRKVRHDACFQLGSTTKDSIWASRISCFRPSVLFPLQGRRPLRRADKKHLCKAAAGSEILWCCPARRRGNKRRWKLPKKKHRNLTFSRDATSWLRGDKWKASLVRFKRRAMASICLEKPQDQAASDQAKPVGSRLIKVNASPAGARRWNRHQETAGSF